MQNFAPYKNFPLYGIHRKCSKNRSGSLAVLRVENEVVPSYATLEAGIRCHAKLLDMYLNKIPPEAKKKDVFYLHPVGERFRRVWLSVGPPSFYNEQMCSIFTQLPRNQLILWLHGTIQEGGA